MLSELGMVGVLVPRLRALTRAAIDCSSCLRKLFDGGGDSVGCGRTTTMVGVEVVALVSSYTLGGCWCVGAVRCTLGVGACGDSMTLVCCGCNTSCILPIASMCTLLLAVAVPLMA